MPWGIQLCHDCTSSPIIYREAKWDIKKVTFLSENKNNSNLLGSYKWETSRATLGLGTNEWRRIQCMEGVILFPLQDQNQQFSQHLQPSIDFQVSYLYGKTHICAYEPTLGTPVWWNLILRKQITIKRTGNKSESKVKPISHTCSTAYDLTSGGFWPLVLSHQKDQSIFKKRKTRKKSIFIFS